MTTAPKAEATMAERDKHRPIQVHCIGLLIQQTTCCDDADAIEAAYKVWDYAGQPACMGNPAALSRPAPTPAAEVTGERRADTIMRQIWKEWFEFYTKHFRGPGIAISMCDQIAFYEIAQPLLRAIATPCPDAGRVPEGWKLVPIDATDAMKLAADNCRHRDGFGKSWRAQFDVEYYAALAASPAHDEVKS